MIDRVDILLQLFKMLNAFLIKINSFFCLYVSNHDSLLFKVKEIFTFPKLSARRLKKHRPVSSG